MEQPHQNIPTMEKSKVPQLSTFPHYNIFLQKNMGYVHKTAKKG